MHANRLDLSDSVHVKILDLSDSVHVKRLDLSDSVHVKRLDLCVIQCMSRDLTCLIQCMSRDLTCLIQCMSRDLPDPVHVKRLDGSSASVHIESSVCFSAMQLKRTLHCPILASTFCDISVYIKVKLRATTTTKTY